MSPTCPANRIGPLNGPATSEAAAGRAALPKGCSIVDSRGRSQDSCTAIAAISAQPPSAGKDWMPQDSAYAIPAAPPLADAEEEDATQPDVCYLMELVPLEIVQIIMKSRCMRRPEDLHGFVEALRCAPDLVKWKQGALDRFGELLGLDFADNSKRCMRMRERLCKRKICTSCGSEGAAVCPVEWSVLPLCLGCVQTMKWTEIFNKTDARRLKLSESFEELSVRCGGFMRNRHGGMYIHVPIVLQRQLAKPTYASRKRKSSATVRHPNKRLRLAPRGYVDASKPPPLVPAGKSVTAARRALASSSPSCAGEAVTNQGPSSLVIVLE